MWLQTLVCRFSCCGYDKPANKLEVSSFRNWQSLFGIRVRIWKGSCIRSGLKGVGLQDRQNYNIYVTGESHAGRYIPYITAAMLDQNDTECFDLSGKLMLLYRETFLNLDRSTNVRPDDWPV